MEGDSSLRAEKEEEEEAKWLQKKVKASENPKAVPASTKPTAPVMVAGTRTKKGMKVAREKVEVQKKTIS